MSRNSAAARRSARAQLFTGVEHQAEINDPAKGDKGFTPAFVGETITTRFWNQEHRFEQARYYFAGALLGACWNARRMWWRPIKQ
jgi:hypothetical protein